MPVGALNTGAYVYISDAFSLCFFLFLILLLCHSFNPRLGYEFSTYVPVRVASRRQFGVLKRMARQNGAIQKAARNQRRAA